MTDREKLEALRVTFIEMSEAALDRMEGADANEFIRNAGAHVAWAEAASAVLRLLSEQPTD